MLYHLFFGIHGWLTVFNVFRYITFRTVLAVLTALVISFLLTPRAIKKFQWWNINNGKREDVPDRHEAKKSTPTMGGVHHPDRDDHPYAPMGRLAERVYLDRHDDARALRGHRLHR